MPDKRRILCKNITLDLNYINNTLSIFASLQRVLTQEVINSTMR